MKAYNVTVTREDNWWLGECVQVPAAHTFGASLKALRQGMEDVIILAEDLPDDARVDVRFCADESLPADVRAAFELGLERERLEAALRDVQERTRLAALTLHAAGFNVRDIGQMVGVSGGRIHQLLNA